MRETGLMSDAKFVAWIEQWGAGDFMAAFVGAAARRRAPATQRCSSPDEARQWVEREAVKVGVGVEWVAPPVRLPARGRMAASNAG
jgi:hypothetical protein